MDQEKRFEIDGVTYVMRPANAAPAWAALKRAGALLRGVELSAGDAQNMAGSKAAGAIIANLGDPAIAEIERIVIAHTNVAPAAGQPFKLVDQFDQHFNQHRAHLIQVLVEGVLYQFSDFFAGGMAAVARFVPMLAKKTPPLSTGSSSDQ